MPSIAATALGSKENATVAYRPVLSIDTQRPTEGPRGACTLSWPGSPSSRPSTAYGRIAFVPIRSTPPGQGNRRRRRHDREGADHGRAVRPPWHAGGSRQRLHLSRIGRGQLRCRCAMDGRWRLDAVERSSRRARQPGSIDATRSDDRFTAFAGRHAQQGDREAPRAHSAVRHSAAASASVCPSRQTSTSTSSW